MALKQIRIGSLVNIHQYDAAVFDSALETDQPIKAGAPIDSNDVLRLNDIGGVIGGHSFLARLSATSLNRTGDGTVVYPVFDTESFDQGGVYNNATGIFTASIAGKYLFTANLVAQGLLAAHSGHTFHIVTSGGQAVINNDSFNAGTNPFVDRCFAGSTIVKLAVGGTAKVLFIINGGTKVVDLIGGAALYTSFSGVLLSKEP